MRPSNAAYPATILHPSGDSQTCFLPAGANARLQTLRDLVGGDIEVVPVIGKRYLVLDEEGKRKAHRPNDFATWLAHESGSIPPGDYIAGVAILVPIAALD